MFTSQVNVCTGGTLTDEEVSELVQANQPVGKKLRVRSLILDTASAPRPSCALRS